MTTGERFLQIKCSVNTRMPLEDRLIPIQGTSVRALKESAPPTSAFLQRRHPIESTYNASLRSAVRSAHDVPQRVKEFSASQCSSPSVAGGGGGGGRAVSAAQQGFASTHRFEYTTGSQPTDEELSFFSRVRRIEQADQDAARQAKRGALRTEDILRKRETAPELNPPGLDMTLYRTAAFAGSRRSASSSSNGGGVSSFSATIHRSGTDGSCCTIDPEDIHNHPLMPITTYQREYEQPQHVFPESLSQTFQVQRSVLSEFSNSRDLFLGTAKSAPKQVLPLFMGHVPINPKNRDKILGEGKEILRPFSKCTINMASSKGVSSLSRASRPARDDASIASTVMGFYTLQAAKAAPQEKAMNQRAPGS